MSNLKTLRKAANLSQEELSRRANISLKTICALEQGVRNIDECKISTLAAIGNVLKIDCRRLCEELFFYDLN